MIRVTVELVSAIDPSRDRVLGVAHIANTGRGEHGKYAYDVALSKWAPKERETWKAGRVGIVDDQLIADQIAGTIASFDREKRGAWDLLYLALKAVVGTRNMSPGFGTIDGVTREDMHAAIRNGDTKMAFAVMAEVSGFHDEE